MFYDPKAGAYSASRVIMGAGFLLTAAVVTTCLYICLDSYTHGKTIPDLTWLISFGSGSSLTSVTGYAMNQWGNRSTMQSYEGLPDNASTVVGQGATNVQTSLPDDDIPAHPTPEGEEAE